MKDNVLRRGSSGEDVRRLQRALDQTWGYDLQVDGVFGPLTQAAVRDFQSRHHDLTGAPLVVDGEVGELTWWAVQHPEAGASTSAPPNLPGKGCAARALRFAQKELEAGAGEVGGNNKGPYCRKYLEPAGLDEGDSWCAAFVSWCFLQACGGKLENMPFRYTAGARNLFNQGKAKGWQVSDPAPGDLAVWWRGSLKSGFGHIGFVEAVQDGFVHTVEGNHTSKVDRFRYVLSRIERFLGFIRVPADAC